MGNLGNLGNQDPTKLEETGGEYPPLPPGDYTVAIKSSGIKTTQAGSEYLNLCWEVLEGQYTNRLVWESLHLWHGIANPETAIEFATKKKGSREKAIESIELTRKIANNSLKRITNAVGLAMTPRSSEELHGKPAVITLKVRPANGDYPARNEVSGYKSMGSIPVASTVPRTVEEIIAAPGIPAAAAAEPSASAVSAMPWE